MFSFIPLSFLRERERKRERERERERGGILETDEGYMLSLNDHRGSVNKIR